MNEMHLFAASPAAVILRQTPEFNTERAFEGALLHLSRAERRERRQAELQRKATQTQQAIGRLLQPLTQRARPAVRAAR